jgi:hypothetical protein
MATLERFQPRAVTAFAALTLFIWTTRIPLAWTNDEDTVGEKLLWSTPITLFWLAAAALLVLQARGEGTSPVTARLTRVFAAATIAYWTIRIVMIVAGDWSIGFKVVHAVLAIASSVAAALAWRSLDATPTRPVPAPAT